MKTRQLCLITGLTGLLLSIVPAQNVKIVSPDERQLSSRFNIAQRFEREGQIAQAAEIYKYLVDAQPANASYYNVYVNLLFSQKNVPELERVISRFAQLNPKNESAAIDYGKLCYVRGDSAAAFQEWYGAVEKFGYAVSFYRNLFNGMIGLKLFDEAEHLIAEARDHYNQADLLALEMANFQIARGDYSTAMGEYLLFARSNPRNYAMISGQILRFPADSALFVTLDSLLEAELIIAPDNPDLHRLRADFLFKYEKFDQARNEIFRVEELTGNRGDQAMAMAKNLVQIKRYPLAQQFYAQILAKKELHAVAPQALLGLADAFEKAVLEETTAAPLHYFYPGNLFFNTEFVQQVSQDHANLQKAFAIYDSVIATQPKSVYSAQALFRLADLRFRVVRDFDGALSIFQQVLTATRDQNLIAQCQERIGAVLIARGDPRVAAIHFRRAVDRWEGATYEKDLRADLVLAQFLAQDFDSLSAGINDLIALLGTAHPLFNDVVEFDGFFRSNYVESDAPGQKSFSEFAKAELLFRQNKLSEAEQVYAFILSEYPLAPINSAARFRLMQIQLQFHRSNDAEVTAEPLFVTGNEFSDRAAFMLAEVADRRDDDLRLAARFYEIVLEKYPDSLLIDIARKRLRELQQNPSPKKEI
ncbi:MAG: hypothetical protein V1681_06310 [Candidatus Neomarinimicrobiota bacterium]